MKRTLFLIAILSVTIFSNTFAQTTQRVVKPVQLSGPRLGFTYITPGEAADSLQSKIGMTPLFTQFGWQFETQYFALSNGTAGLVEFVGLIGGLEQNKFLPSGSLLIGIRAPSGTEFAFGPNLSLSGAAFVLAAGHTFKNGDLNFPVNFAVVPSSKGIRFSLLFGFNAQTRE
ncbi:MAG: hypothetical protein K9I48_08035 [Sphingobacteriales bacterium]|nr:hypothetical protein [Sphingobacteriales bacterium]